MDKYSERREQKQQTGWIDFAEPHLILYKYSNYNPFPDFINKKIKENYTDKTTAQPQMLRLSGHTDRVIDPCCLKNHGFLFSHLCPQPGNRHTAGDTAENTHYSGPEIFRKIPYPGIQAQSNTRS